LARFPNKQILNFEQFFDQFIFESIRMGFGKCFSTGGPISKRERFFTPQKLSHF